MKKKYLASLAAMMFSASSMAASSCGDKTVYDYDTSLYGVVAIGTDKATSGMGNHDSFTLTGGYRFSDKLAFEINYALLGKFQQNNIPNPPTVDVSATSLSIFGKYPIDEWAHYSVFGRIGISSTSKIFNTIGMLPVSVSKTAPSFGFGLETVLGDSGFNLRAGIDRYYTGELIQLTQAKDRIDVISVAILMNF